MSSTITPPYLSPIKIRYSIYSYPIDGKPIYAINYANYANRMLIANMQKFASYDPEQMRTYPRFEYNRTIKKKLIKIAPNDANTMCSIANE